jgi:hypothetical protein
MGVAEILIGLSGNAALNKRDTLDKAFKSLSVKEIQLIAESDYRNRFLEMYHKLSTVDYISELMPEDSAVRTNVKVIISKVD